MISDNEAARRARVEKALEKRWRALLCDVAEELRARGVNDPHVYIEGEAGLYAVDGDHPLWRDESMQRQEAVVFGPFCWPRGVSCDVGAW